MDYIARNYGEYLMNQGTRDGFAIHPLPKGRGLLARQDKIFSTPFTGYGEGAETEVVTLGGYNNIGQVMSIPHARFPDSSKYEYIDQVKKAIQPWVTDTQQMANNI